MQTVRSILVATALFMGMLAPAGAVGITGAGPRQSASVIAKWGEAYRAAGGERLRYRVVSPCLEIKEIKDLRYDFLGWNYPMSREMADVGMVQFPVLFDGVVLIANIPGIDSRELRLDGPTIADIYLGKIKRWDDPQIAALNPGLALPRLPIIPVFRAEASGTTAAFREYLSQISREWRDFTRRGSSVTFPVGAGGRGNGGVLGLVRLMKGAIGYARYASAKYSGIPIVALRNHDGVFLEPDKGSFRQAVLRSACVGAECPVLFVDRPGAGSWPIVTATFAVFRGKSQRSASDAGVLRFFAWVYRHGAHIAEASDYVPMPAEAIPASWATTVEGNGGRQRWQ